MPCIRIARTCSFCASVICLPPQILRSFAVFGIHTGCAKTAISKFGKIIKTSCFYIFLREKSPFYDAVCDETPYVHRCRQNRRQPLEKHDKSVLSFFCAFHISNSVRVPTDRGPCKFAFFHTRGADGLVFALPQRFRPAPRGSPSPQPRPIGTPLSHSQYLYSGV